MREDQREAPKDHLGGKPLGSTFRTELAEDTLSYKDKQDIFKLLSIRERLVCDTRAESRFSSPDH